MFQMIGFAVRYLPLVIAAVQMVEGMVSKDTSGEAKRVLATRFVIESLSRLGVKTTDRVEVLIGQTIDLAVSVLNFFGFFVPKEDVEDDEEELKLVSADVAEAKAVEIRSETDARLDELEDLLTDAE